MSAFRSSSRPTPGSVSSGRSLICSIDHLSGLLGESLFGGSTVLSGASTIETHLGGDGCTIGCQLFSVGTVRVANFISPWWWVSVDPPPMAEVPVRRTGFRLLCSLSGEGAGSQDRLHCPWQPAPLSEQPQGRRWVIEGQNKRVRTVSPGQDRLEDGKAGARGFRFGPLKMSGCVQLKVGQAP